MRKPVILYLLLGIGYVTLLKAQIPAYVAQRLQFTLDSICDHWKIKGTSAAILVPGVGEWNGTNGISHQGVPMTKDMLLCMGSNTKTHISALMLLMQEKGLINLDDTIGSWIHGYPNISGKATIRQCLNHSSGIYDYFHNDAVNDSLEKIYTPDDILKLAKAPNFAPGQGWSYSNTNYIIAGIIINEVLHQHAFSAIHDQVLQPNNLLHTFAYGEQPSPLVIAHPWSMNITGSTLTDLSTTPYMNSLYSLASTAGALMTTASDNVNFWHKLVSGQIVSSDSWKQMTKTIKLSQGYEYGLGIFRFKNSNNRVVYSHGGTFFGFISENMVDTLTGICYSVLTNQDSVNNDGLQNLILGNLQKLIIQYNVGISEHMALANAIHCYPNPASNMLSIESNEPLDCTISLVDITGKTIMEGDVFRGTQHVLDVSQIPSGIYYLTFSNENAGTSSTQKIVVLH